MKSELGIYITNRKKHLKVTQDWIAEKLEVSSNAVSKWVKTGKISRENFFALVELIGSEGAPYLDNVIEGESRRIDVVTKPDLIYVKTIPPPGPITELVRIAGNVSEEGLKMILSYAYHVETTHPVQAKQTRGSSQ